jgi:hypothetical protein
MHAVQRIRSRMTDRRPYHDQITELTARVVRQ